MEVKPGFIGFDAFLSGRALFKYENFESSSKLLKKLDSYHTAGKSDELSASMMVKQIKSTMFIRLRLKSKN